MKFAVGDKVVINKELWYGGFAHYGIKEVKMLILPLVCTIKQVNCGDYYLDEDNCNYYWDEKSLIPLSESSISTAQLLFLD